MATRSSFRDVMTWGSILDHEPDENSRRAKNLFQRSKNKLSLGSGNDIPGLNGNDRALACLCLCIVKMPGLAPSDHKSLETSLQRTSGVAPRIFSNALKSLSMMLGTASQPGTPSKNASARAKKATPTPARNDARDSGTKRKREADPEAGPSRDVRSSLFKSSPVKRRASIVPEDEDEIMLSPTNKKRIRTSTGHQTFVLPESLTGEPPNCTPRSVRITEPSSARTIKKTPLNLPIQRPPKPMCIFHSKPVFRPQQAPKRINFGDWNWKQKLFRSDWSLDDVREWENWHQKSIRSSLS